jgi:hypothetical protein
MMTDNESLSLREAVDYCGSGVTVREATRLRRLAHDLPRWAAGNHPRFGAAGVDAVTRAGRSRKVGSSSIRSSLSSAVHGGGRIWVSSALGPPVVPNHLTFMNNMSCTWNVVSGARAVPA